MTREFRHLLAPGRIGTLEVRNRTIMTAMGSMLAEPGGFCGERIRAYYEERAKGGVGLIVMGSVGVGYPVGAAMPRPVAISTDDHIPGIRALADAAHGHGAKLALQLHFGGLVAMEDMLSGRPVWTPSVPVYRQGDWLDGFLEQELAEAPFTKIAKVDYKELTPEDIRALVALFADGARRAREARCDGVEIHGGHGYIISSFLSPLTNQRTDDYGGSVENRSRLLVEIIRACKAAAGSDFPVWCKIDSQEFLQDEGITVEDARVTARLAQDAGADAITVSAYHDTSRGVGHSNSNIPDPPELMVPNAIAIKSALRVPVIASGRIEPEDAERHIAEGHFDFLGLGRKLLADPHLPRKLADGKPHTVRPCIYCYTCVSQIYVCRNVRCAVNPETAYERELAIHPAPTAKTVVVVGGGPAGMEAARRLSAKGHHVTLLEASDRLGGTARFAAIAYEPNERIVQWLEREVQEARIDVRLSTSADVGTVRALKPQAVVVATGAVRARPDIPGAGLGHVFGGDELRQLVLGQNLQALGDKVDWKTRIALRTGAAAGVTRDAATIREASRRWMPLGQRIVILGGELVGLELAEFLAHRGRKVTVLEPASRAGAGLPIVRRWRVLDELRHAGVVLLTRASDIRIAEGEVSYVNWRRQTRTIACDQVIVAMGATGDLSLAEKLRAAGLEVHEAGDCRGVGYIDGAMRSAAEVAQRI
jgi:2,4-dienoyl-CoA reductase-like NADH-dependent reductase (Old Yellow Enzyme family)/NADPH-dependent 2,4-dienoyl-CoA reductase/sulfur reductase-like enzyme